MDVSNWFSSIWSRTESRDWRHQLEHLLDDTAEKKINYAAVILNHCLDAPELKYNKNDESTLDNNKIRRLIKLWNNASIRHVVDGGANYLNDLQQLAKSRSAEDAPKDPQLLTGDMDSIRGDVLAHYRNTDGCNVLETPDQDHTDFTKAIKELGKQKTLAEREVKSIVVFYTSCGRLDHVLSIYNTLYKFGKDIEESTLPPLILVDLASSISLLLTKGKHQIPSVKNAKWCSLVPLNGPATLTTTGFRWNLNKDTLEFGKFISTSQEFDGKSEQATVDIADKPILFSVDFQADQSQSQ